MEANALVRGIGRERIEALELGNEPELYGLFTWGISNATGRPPGYGFSDFENDFTRIARALPAVPLAGPSLAGGAIGTHGWFQYLGQFLSDEPRVAVATVHRYPLQRCYVSPQQPDYPTIANLLAPAASRALAASVAGAVKAAHAHRIPLRIDEMNTDSCGLVPAVTDSFASALWALDALFSMANVGVDGVNIHTYPLAGASLFGFHRVDRRWRATVQPEYYGLQMFAQAAPPGVAAAEGLARRRGAPRRVGHARARPHDPGRGDQRELARTSSSRCDPPRRGRRGRGGVARASRGAQPLRPPGRDAWRPELGASTATACSPGRRGSASGSERPRLRVQGPGGQRGHAHAPSRLRLHQPHRRCLDGTFSMALPGLEPGRDGL